MKIMNIDECSMKMKKNNRINQGVGDTLLNLIDLIYPTVFFIRELKLMKYDQIDRSKHK